jgi:hypothetical protein
MGKIQEVYKYTANIDKYSEVLLAANNNNAVNTDRTAVTNNVFTLYDKSSTKDVGKVLYNAFKSVFYKKVNTKDTADIIIFDVNFCLFFDDDLDSYITYNIVYNSKDGYIDKNKTFVAKATGTGGKYAGKDVTVTLKTAGNSRGRKVILEYEK